MAIRRAITFAGSFEPVEVECPPFFKIYPCPKTFPKPTQLIGHFPHFIDYTVRERFGVRGITEMSYSLDKEPVFEGLQTVPIPDELVLACDTSDILNEIIDIVNALATRPLINYGAYQAWFTELGSNDYKPRFGQEFYHHPEIGTPTDVNPTPGFAGRDENVLTVRNEDGHLIYLVKMRELLEFYFNAPASNKKNLFRSACRIAARAQRIAQFDLSTSFLLLISSIEALVNIKHLGSPVERCTECGQERYRVVRKFKDFLDEYCWEIEPRVKDRLYNLRSGLVHQGRVLPLEESNRFYVENAAELKARYEATLSRTDLDRARNATLACFRSFLFREFRPGAKPTPQHQPGATGQSI